MRRLFAVCALVLASCASDASSPRTFANSDPELAVGNGAKMGCSCMFVMNMSEAFCRAWVRASPDVARVSFDATAKTVEAAAFLSWAAKARFVDEQHGCVLE
jgi:hypothetical protein